MYVSENAILYLFSGHFYSTSYTCCNPSIIPTLPVYHLLVSLLINNPIYRLRISPRYIADGRVGKPHVYYNHKAEFIGRRESDRAVNPTEQQFNHLNSQFAYSYQRTQQ